MLNGSGRQAGRRETHVEARRRGDAAECRPHKPQAGGAGGIRRWVGETTGKRTQSLRGNAYGVERMVAKHAVPGRSEARLGSEDIPEDGTNGDLDRAHIYSMLKAKKEGAHLTIREDLEALSIEESRLAGLAMGTGSRTNFVGGITASALGREHRRRRRAEEDVHCGINPVLLGARTGTFTCCWTLTSVQVNCLKGRPGSTECASAGRLQDL
ncbi:hypothetical protein C8R44DRAFT_733215 [Mycena epipterygia]|nr:hypothetical protein C8R44DRAFT_733215 [Mycena epipterygia]